MATQKLSNEDVLAVKELSNTRIPSSKTGEPAGVGLHDLPTDHALRCAPLAGCWYRWVKGKEWREVKPSYGIAGATYNDLGAAWTDHSVFCWEPVSPNVEVEEMHARGRPFVYSAATSGSRWRRRG